MLKINKITDKEFTINENGKVFKTHAVYAADIENGLVHVYPLNGKGKVFSAQPSDILVNDEKVTGDNVLNKLDFIGNFKSGGSSSSNNGIVAWGNINGNLENQSDLTSRLNSILGIAEGAHVALVFDSEQQIDDWLSGTYERPDGVLPSSMKPGWNLYTRNSDDHDFWWDGSGIIPLVEKTDLSNYYDKTVLYTKSEVDLLLKSKTDIESNSDWYLDAINGDDANDGKTSQTAFKTYEKISSYFQNTLLPAAVTVNLAAGTYSTLNFNDFRWGSIKTITFKGNPDNPETVIVNNPGKRVRGFGSITFKGMTFDKDVSSTGDFNIQGCGGCEFQNCIIKQWILIDQSVVYFTQKLELDVSSVNTSSRNYGKILVNSGVARVSPSSFIINSGLAAKGNLMTLQGTGILDNYLEKSKVFVKANGTLTSADNYSGRVLNMYSGNLNNRTEGLRTTFPVGIFSQDPVDCDPAKKDTSIRVPILHPHNLLTKRDDNDCHPISAIGGLQDAIDGKANANDIMDLLDEIDKKADVADLDLKADKTEVALKANISDVDAALALKEDKAATAFGALTTAGTTVSCTKGDLTIAITKNSSGNYATSMIVFSSPRSFQWAFNRNYDAAGIIHVSNRTNDSIASINTNEGYTRGMISVGTVVDINNGIIYEVTFACGNTVTSDRADWAAIKIK